MQAGNFSVDLVKFHPRNSSSLVQTLKISFTYWADYLWASDHDYNEYRQVYSNKSKSEMMEKYGFCF